MAAVTIQEVTRQFGTITVLEGVSLELRSGETAGLVGANGSGKTTLFRLIAGELTPDRGRVTHSRGLQIGYLKQEPEVSLTRTLHDEVGSVFANLLTLEDKLHDLSRQMAACDDERRLHELMQAYERTNARFITAGGHTFETRLNEILGGLGFTPDEYQTPMSVLSGGQKCRAALAKVLLSKRPFLLLDEPTNHLDIDAVRWLEKFLTGHHGGAVIVSHDRYLLDRLCDRIIEIENRKATSYPGAYSNYAHVKQLRQLTQERRYQRDAEFIKKERDFIARNLVARRTKVAKGRRTRLERRLADGEFVTETTRKRRPPKFSLSEARRHDITALRCDGLDMAFDGNVLFTNLTFQVPAGQRFGITGPNGTGKTTLLRILVGELAPKAGTFTLDPKLRIGYYAQEHADLDPDRPVLDEIRAANPGLSEQDARTLLASYLFRGDDVFKPLGLLSGGEQSRVRLATLILETPDLLVLDEPTNHLDIPSREVLESALLEFSGTLIVVSHDRYFLDRIVDRLLVLRRDAHAAYDGNYSSYIDQVERERAAEQTRTSERRRRKDQRSKTPRRSRSAPSPYDPMSIEELEALMMDREAQLAAVHERFGDPAVYKDPQTLAELRKQADALSVELAAIDTAWQERVDAQ